MSKVWFYAVNMYSFPWDVFFFRLQSATNILNAFYFESNSSWCIQAGASMMIRRSQYNSDDTHVILIAMKMPFFVFVCSIFLNCTTQNSSTTFCNLLCVYMFFLSFSWRTVSFCCSYSFTKYLNQGEYLSFILQAQKPLRIVENFGLHSSLFLNINGAFPVFRLLPFLGPSVSL